MTSVKEMQVLTGLGASDGIAIGRAVCVETRTAEVYRFPLSEEAVPGEIERFEAAARQAHEQINRTRERVAEFFGPELAAIFDAHSLLLGDESFRRRIATRISDERVNAEWAVLKSTEELADQLASVEHPYLRERSEDLHDVGRHLLRSLQGIAHHEISEIKGDVIVVADDLTPSDAVRLGRGRVMGFAIETGGRTSHTTIIARSLSIPLVTGLSKVTQLVTDEDPVVVDGTTGTVILHPTPEVIEEYQRRLGLEEGKEQELLATSELAAITRDGVEIELMANIDLPEEIDEARRFGARGVGLYRSEFLYIERDPRLPTEEDHLAIYRQLAEAAAPHPAVIRTYDLGGRKLARELMETFEDNPVLGLRGIRLTLSRPHLFRTQMRALFRAALCGNLWIMAPMVSTVGEVRRFRSFAEEVMRELADEGVPFSRDFKFGIMIEVPAAAIIADLLAREVDFFSIGTNDLIQYALAVDRNNEHVTDLYQPLHPAILRMLRFVVQSAERAGIPVSLCGEMAADPTVLPLLLGLGLRQLSMSPRLVPTIKAQVRDLVVGELARVVDHCTQLATATEVEQYLDKIFSENRKRPST